MSTAAEALRSARTARSASARQLARLAGVAPSRWSEIEREVHDPSVRTLDRLLRAAGAQVATIPTRAPTAATVAWEISRCGLPNGSSEERAFRALLALSDGLTAAALDVRVALCVTPPILTGDRRFDAAIAGIVEHHLSRSGLPLPAWVSEAERTLPAGSAWIPDPYADESVLDATPAALARHGVLLAARELEST